MRFLSLSNQSGSGFSFDKKQPKQIAAQLYCIAAQKGGMAALVNLGLMLYEEKIAVTNEILKIAELPQGSSLYQVVAKLFSKSMLPEGKQNFAYLIYSDHIAYDENGDALADNDAKCAAICRLTGDTGMGHYLKALAFKKYKKEISIEEAIHEAEIALEKGYYDALSLYLELKKDLSDSAPTTEASANTMQIDQQTEEDSEYSDDEDSGSLENDQLQDATNVSSSSSSSNVSSIANAELTTEQFKAQQQRILEEWKQKVIKRKERLKEERRKAFTLDSKVLLAVNPQQKSYNISWSKAALKDFYQLTEDFQTETLELVDDIQEEGKQGQPEKLQGNHYYSRRMSKKDRLVYEIGEKEIKIVSCKGHYKRLLAM